MIKSINKQNPKHIKDFLIQETRDILVRDGKDFTKNETKELIYTPYLIFNFTRVEYVNNKLKNVFNHINIDLEITMANRQKYIFTGVVIYHSNHYVCAFKFGKNWYYYNDMSENKIINYGPNFNNLVKKIPKTHNPNKKGILYFYTPVEPLIPKQ